MAVVAPLIVAWIAFRPLGAYPANDDFLFARSVQLWTDEERFVLVSLNRLPAVSALTPIVCGWLACEVWGFSYEVLHAVSVTAGAVGGLALFALGCRAGLSLVIGCLLAWSLILGPFVFGHSFTFMTDTHAVAWTCVALWAYERGLRSGSWAWLGAGSVLAALAVWTRQTAAGIVVFPVVALGLAARETPLLPWRRAALRGLGAVAGPLMALALLYLRVFDRGRDGPALLATTTGLRQVALDAYEGFLLVGLFALPAAPLLWEAERHRQARRPARQRRLVSSLGTVVGGLLMAAFLVSKCQAYVTNATGYFLQNAHLGPVILSDHREPGRWGDMGGVTWPVAFWQGVTVLCIVTVAVTAMAAGGTLIDAYTRFRSRPARRGENSATGDEAAPSPLSIEAALVVTLVATAAALLGAVGTRFDRYWMALLPALYGWMALTLSRDRIAAWRRRTLAASVFLAAALASLSVAFTHDYLAWNQARWRLVERWLAEGMAPAQIDGGYEINGWFRSAEDIETTPRPGEGERAWWAVDPQRHVAVGPRPGFTVVSESGWSSWATGGRHRVLGLMRASAEPAEP